MTQLEASKPNDIPARVTEVKEYLQRVKMTFRERSLNLCLNFGHKLYVMAGGKVCLQDGRVALLLCITKDRLW